MSEKDLEILREWLEWRRQTQDSYGIDTIRNDALERVLDAVRCFDLPES